MRLLEIDWGQFLEDLPCFQRLPCEARRQYLVIVRPSQPIALGAPESRRCEPVAGQTSEWPVIRA
jgi:hypothetical protein